MANRLIGFLLAVSSLTLLTSCKKADAPPQSASPSNPVTAQSNLAIVQPLPATLNQDASQGTQGVMNVVTPERRARLKPQWPVGNRYVYRMDLEQRSTNHVAQATQSIVEQVTMGVTYALRVLKETAGGGRELEVEFLAYELEIKVGEKTVVNFDSARPATNETQNPMIAPFRKLIGTKLSLELQAGGKAVKVSALNEWVQGITGGKQDAGELMLAQQFNEGFFQQLADFGRGLPGGPVEVGQSWPYTTEMPAGAIGKIAAESSITFRRWEEHEHRRLAILETKGSLIGIPGPQAAGSMSLEDGTVLGTSWFDPELGGPIESVVEQSMRLKGDAPAAPELNRAAFGFTTDIGQKVTVKLAELTKPEN
jgi:hypothetical protein